MLYRLSNAGAIIYSDSANRPALRCNVDEDKRNVLSGEAIQEWLFNSKRHYSDPIDLSLKHPLDADLHAAAVIRCRSDQDFIVRIDRFFLKALDQLRKERICDVGNNDTDQPATT